MSQRFFVPGTCKTKGSWRAITNRKTGKAFLKQDCASGADWQRLVSSYAAQHRPKALWTGAVKLSLVFTFLKPKSAKNRQYPIVKPDIDKTERVILDSLTGIFFRDDSQVVMTHCVKEYGDNPGVHIHAEELP